MSGALDGIRIVDLTNLGPGPYCTRILADLGADVVRVVEIGAAGGRRGGRIFTGPWYAYGMRRNTKLLGANLKSEEGLEVLHKLVAKADVILVGLRPSAAERLHVDYQSMRQANPEIIYASVTAYGADSPYKDLAGHDINYQSLGGSVGMTGPRNGPPMIPGTTSADSAGGGMHAAIAVLAAIVHKQKTGEGQFVDVAATDGIVTMMSTVLDEYLATGVEPKRGETITTGKYPWYGIYETKDDKYMSLGPVEAWFYENLCRLVGREDLIPYQFAEGEKNDEIRQVFTEVFRTKTRDEWTDLLLRADTCATPVYSISEVCSDSSLLHRQMIVEVDHPTRGKVKQTGMMVKLSKSPGGIRNVDPQIGDFTESILDELGYSKTRIDQLIEIGVIK